ncbi:hypothetical protein C8R43DRAFT_831290, partial [Mycena crocata]
LAREHRDEWVAHTVALYQAEKIRVLGPNERRKGSRQICEAVEDEYFTKYKKYITPSLSHVTITRLANGGQTKSESNAAKSWLLDEEAELLVIGYAIELASRGFPLNHRRLKDCADNILRARLGAAFPEDGVGGNWSHRFLEKYSHRLQTCW